ncbi:MAG: hypothetical protein ACPLYF_01485 [Fervidobacterium sp.]
MVDQMIKTHYPINNNKKLFFVFTTLLIAWGVMTIVPLVFRDKTGRLLSDSYDRSVYFERGRWFTEGTIPISEYPQIPTFLFGINNLTSMWVNHENHDMQVGVYSAFFSLGMLLILFLISKALLELLPPRVSNYMFLVLFPPTLYFTYNRFDILPAYLCLIAYNSATKKQWTMTSIILAIATFTKWYPVLLFPGFFAYATTLEKKFKWNMVVGFTITSIVIVLASYLYGGLESVLAPYKFHMARGMEYVAFPVLVDNLIRGVLGTQVSLPYFFLLFFIAQISAPILIFFTKIDSFDTLVDYCIIVIGVFVFFSRIWSPQWFLWLLPFLIISANNIKKVGLIILYNLATYLCFPLIFDYYGWSSYQLQISSLLTYLILFAIIFQSVKNLKLVFNNNKT